MAELSDELPLHPAAVGALDFCGELTFDALAAALAGRESWVLSDFLDRFRENSATHWVPVARESLLAAARRETEIRGDNVVRCEYLLLGGLRAAGSSGALDTARKDFQELMADRAYRRYLRLRALPRLDGAPAPCAVLVAGLPGTGKSTLAEGLAWSLRAPAFSMDWELGTLAPFGVLRSDNTWPMSELMMVSSMARQLQLGSDAILDAASLSAGERRRLQAVAQALDAVFIGVECVCSDEEAHRDRLRGRSRGIPGWPAVQAPAAALATILKSVQASRGNST